MSQVGTKNYVAHDRAGMRGLEAQRHALGMHSTEARAIEEFCRDPRILCRKSVRLAFK